MSARLPTFVAKLLLSQPRQFVVFAFKPDNTRWVTSMGAIRGRLVSLIPQSPAAALNPALRIETQLKEAWRAHSRLAWLQQKARILQLLESVGLSQKERLLRRSPNEISVGQAQRVLTAMALLHAPPLLIADEPTSALDALTQHDVLELLARTVRERRMSMLFISHDLTAVAAISHRIAILYGGAPGAEGSK